MCYCVHVTSSVFRFRVLEDPEENPMTPSSHGAGCGQKLPSRLWRGHISLAGFERATKLDGVGVDRDSGTFYEMPRRIRFPWTNSELSRDVIHFHLLAEPGYGSS